MSIQVLTDNGKMPADGGKRFGWLVRDHDGVHFIDLNGGDWLLLAPVKKGQETASPALSPIKDDLAVASTKREEKQRKEEPLVHYSLLPRTFFSDGECHICNHFPNLPKHIATDEGLRPVIICGRCGHKMRPKD